MTVSNAAPVPSPEGHEAAMVAAYNDAQSKAKASAQAEAPAPTDSGNERPSWLPEKFSSPEDMAQAYRQLEARLSQAPKGGNQQQPQTTQEEAKNQVEAVGLDYSAMEQEWASNGQLSGDSYAKLEAAGIPRDMVDAYIAGQEALAAGIQQEVFGVVGGQDKYQEMVQWASKNLTPAQIEAYDRAVSSNDKDAIILAVEGLKSRYASAGGMEPNLLNGGTATDSGEVFRSTAELTQAMRDPRYAKDPAYRADVMERLKRSQVF